VRWSMFSLIVVSGAVCIIGHTLDILCQWARACCHLQQDTYLRNAFVESMQDVSGPHCGAVSSTGCKCSSTQAIHPM
jgi:hypothetical protein